MFQELQHWWYRVMAQAPAEQLSSASATVTPVPALRQGPTTTTSTWTLPHLRSLVWPIATVLIAASLWVWYKWLTNSAGDDAFITFRYAENIARGQGFVYNAGEHVMGTTTPLYTLLLAGLGWLLGPPNIPQISFVICVLAGAGSGIFTYLTLVELGVPSRYAVLVIAAYLFHPHLLWTATSGMETTFVVFLMSLSFYLFVTRHDGWGFLVCGLAFVTRLDTAIWTSALVLGTMIARRDARLLLRSVWFLAIAVPWLVFATLYFGSPIPHSITAKASIANTAGQHAPFSVDGARDLAGWIVPTVAAPLMAIPNVPARLALLISFLLVGAGVLVFKLRRRELWVPLLFGALYVAAFYLGHSPHFPWYLIPLVWASSIVLGVGLGEVTQIGQRGWSAFGVRTAPLASLAGGVLIAVLACCMALALRSEIATYDHPLRPGGQGDIRENIGEYLQAHSRPGDTVMLEPIGYIGYYSGLHVLDLAGLVSPDVVATYKRVGHEPLIFQWAVESRQPEWIVLRQFEMDENRYYHGGEVFGSDAERELFNSRYVEVARFPERYPTGFTIYQLRSTRGSDRATGV